MFEKYLEQIIEIIYEDRKGNITQRKIQIHSIRESAHSGNVSGDW